MRPAAILGAGVVVALLILAVRAPITGREAVPEVAAMDPTRTPDVRAPVERRLRPMRFEAVPLAPAAQDSVLRAEGLLFAEGALWVIDFGDLRIKRFALDGHLVRALGGGRGRGPGEFVNPTGLAVRGDSVYVVDGGGRALTVFTREGALVRRTSLPLGAHRAVATPEGLFLLTALPDALFAQLSLSGEVTHRFGEVVEGQREGTAYYAAVNAALLPAPGGRVRTPQGEQPAAFLYVPDDADLVFAYAADGRLVHVVGTVGGRGFTAPMRRPDGGAAAPRSPSFSAGVSADGGHLYIHTVVRAAEATPGEVLREAASFLDVYALDDGLTYLHSYALPGLLTDAQVVGNRVYGLDRDRGALVAYGMESP